MIFVRLISLLFCSTLIAQQITPNNVNPNNKQGNGTKFQISGANNNVLGSPLCNDSGGNATTSGCNNTFLNASNYNFIQTPGGSISPGSNTVTLRPVPLGVNATNTNYYVYLSNGTGTAEAVLVTGGSAISGNSSGTITFTAANLHSGAWTIQSASGGIPEAMWVIPFTTGNIIYVNTSIVAYAPTTFPPNRNITVQGPGSGFSIISRSTNFTSGNLFAVTSSSSWGVTIRDIAIEQGVFAQSGSAIYASKCGNGSITLQNVVLSNGNNAVTDQACEIFIRDSSVLMFTTSSPQPFAGIYIQSYNPSGTELTSNVYISNVQIAGIEGSSFEPQYCLYTDGSDGVQINGLATSCSTDLLFNPNSTYVTNWEISNFISDGPLLQAINTTGTGIISNVNIHDGWINGPISGTSESVSLGGVLANFGMANMTISKSINKCIVVGASGSSVDVSLSNINCSDSNTSNTASNPGMYIFAGATGVRLNNIRFHNTASLGHMKFGIQVAGNMSDSQINNITCNLTADASTNECILYNPTSTFTNIQVGSIVDPSISSTSTITAASTISLGVSILDTYTVIGTIPIATINGSWIGRTVTLLFTNASPGGVTTGGNIYTAKSVTQNSTITMRFDGTKWMVL